MNRLVRHSRGLSKLGAACALLVAALVAVGGWFALGRLGPRVHAQPHVTQVASVFPVSSALLVSVRDPLAMASDAATWAPRDALDSLRDGLDFDPLDPASWERWALDPTQPIGVAIAAQDRHLVMLVTIAHTGAADAALAAATATFDASPGSLSWTLEPAMFGAWPGIIAAPSAFAMPAAVWMRDGRLVAAVPIPMDDADADWPAVFHAIALASQSATLVDDPGFRGSAELAMEADVVAWYDVARFAPALHAGLLDFGPVVEDFAPVVAGIRVADDSLEIEAALVLEEASALLAAFDRSLDRDVLRHVATPVIYGTLSNYDIAVVFGMFDAWLRTVPFVGALYSDAVASFEEERGVTIDALLANCTGVVGSFVHSYEGASEAGELVGAFGVVDEATAIAAIEAIAASSEEPVSTRDVDGVTIWTSTADDDAPVAWMVYDGFIWLSTKPGELDAIVSGDVDSVLDADAQPFLRDAVRGHHSIVTWADGAWFEEGLPGMFPFARYLEEISDAVEHITIAVGTEGTRVALHATATFNPEASQALRGVVAGDP